MFGSSARQDGALVVRWHAEEPIDIGVGATPVGVGAPPVRQGGRHGHGPPRGRAPTARLRVTPHARPAPQRSSRSGECRSRGSRTFAIGGYATANGGITRWGVVFRADALHKLTSDDLESFAELGVQTVYDLRAEAERAEFPGPVPSVHLSIVGRPRDVEPPPPPPDLTARHGEEMLRDTYVGALTHSAAEIGTVMRGLADASRTPAVFHCHGGKDRTGLVAAILLLALGVGRDTVLDDYEATSLYRLPDDQHDSLAKMLQAGISPEAAAGVLGTPRWAMAEAVDAVLAAPHGVEGYLTGTAGVAPEELAALRRHLVVHVGEP